MRNVGKKDSLSRVRKSAFATWFELYPARPRVYSNLYWVGASLLLSIATAIAYFVTNNKLFLFTFLPLAIGGGLIVIVTRRVYQTLLDWEDQMRSFVFDKNYSESALKRWFRSHFKNGTQFRTPLICGIVFSIISFFVWGSSGVFSGLGWVPFILAICVLLFTSFLVGIVLCLLYYLGGLILGLGKFDIVVNQHSYGVLSLGNILVKMYAQASFVWFIIALSGVYVFKETPLPMTILGLPTLLFVIGSFVFIQFPVHKQMKEYKRKELQKIDSTLRTLIPYPVEECTPERLEQIKFYRDLANSISNLPEWPYHWKGAAGVTITSLLAASPGIVSFVADTGAGNKLAKYLSIQQ